jgi:hypothetical protein
MEHDQVIALAIAAARARQLYVAHWPDSRRAAAPGWPDLIIIGAGGMIFREVKTGRARPSPEQIAVAYMLAALGHDWRVWDELDWFSGQIENELDALVK